MSETLSEVHYQWVQAFTGVDARSLPPAGGGQAADEQASGGGPAAPSGGGGASGSVKVFGDTFHYLKRVEAQVEPVITEAAKLLSEAMDASQKLSGEVVKLTRLEEKYAKLTDDDIVSEVSHKTDRTLKNEAGDAKGADLAASGFKAILENISGQLKIARDQLQLINKEIEAQGLREKAAYLLKLGREQEERFAAPMKLVSSVVGMIGSYGSIAADPSKALPWAAPAVSFLEGLMTIQSESTRQGLAFEEEARKVDQEVFAGRSRLAREQFGMLTQQVPGWIKLVLKAEHDLESKRGNAEGRYDTKSKQVKGTFQFKDIKDAAELCGKVYELAHEVSAPAHNALILLNGLSNLQGGYTKWMADPAKDGEVFDGMKERTRMLFHESDPKIRWSKTLAAKFGKLRETAGNAMADAPGTA